jgi:hypothetical protein
MKVLTLFLERGDILQQLTFYHNAMSDPNQIPAQWSTFSAVRRSAFHTFAAALGIAFSVRNLTMHHVTATRSDLT